MDYGYQPTEEDLNAHRDFLICEEKAQISKLKSLHESIMPERFFNLVVWDYEFSKSEIVKSTKEETGQLDLFFVDFF